MKRIADLNVAEEQVFQKVNQLISGVRRTVAEEPSSLEAGIRILEQLRKENYENLNQIQHEAMILRAAWSLQRTDLAGEELEWYWNPRQTGGAEEPDLRGAIAGRIEVSAEITTSERPVGTIDQRMETTLKKLSAMPGKRIYFVRTEAMEERARAKIDKTNFQIEVRRI